MLLVSDMLGKQFLQILKENADQAILCKNLVTSLTFSFLVAVIQVIIMMNAYDNLICLNFARIIEIPLD